MYSVLREQMEEFQPLRLTFFSTPVLEEEKEEEEQQQEEEEIWKVRGAEVVGGEGGGGLGEIMM